MILALAIALLVALAALYFAVRKIRELEDDAQTDDQYIGLIEMENDNLRFELYWQRRTVLALRHEIQLLLEPVVVPETQSAPSLSEGDATFILFTPGCQVMN